MVCKSLHVTQRLVRRLRVGDPWFVVHFVLSVTALQGLFVSFENVYFPAGELAVSCGVPCLYSLVDKTIFTIFCDDSDVFDGVHHGCCSLVLSQCPVTLLQVLRIKLHLAFALGEWTSICGSISRFFCLGMICCVYVSPHGSTQRASDLDLAGPWYCRRWYTWSDGPLGSTFDVCSPWPEEETSDVQVLFVSCDDGARDFGPHHHFFARCCPFPHQEIRIIIGRYLPALCCYRESRVVIGHVL